jgi:hypothetical protein
MSSPGIDKWVEKHPEWWAEQAEKATNQTKIKKHEFKKLLKKGLANTNKETLLQYISKQNLEKIYEKSKFYQPRGVTIDKPVKPTKPSKITVKRKGKTYTRSTPKRWETKTNLALKITAKLKPRSKEYKEYVKNIVESTGRTRQAVIKKIQRIRKKR